MALTDKDVFLIQTASHPILAAYRAEAAAHQLGATVRETGHYSEAGSPAQESQVRFNGSIPAADVVFMYLQLAEMQEDMGGGSLAITGTMMDNTATEAEVVAGGNTCILTLTGATWATDIATDPAKRRALTRALFAAGGEEWDWNTKVMPAVLASPTAIVRTSNTVVTITFPAVAGYSIGSNDTINFLCPPDLVVPAVPISVATTAALDVTTITAS